MIPLVGTGLDVTQELFEAHIEAHIAKVSKWTAKKRLEVAAPHTKSSANGTAFIIHSAYALSASDYMDVVACASYASRGVANLGQVIRSVPRGCQTCQYCIVHNEYAQCDHPQYGDNNATGSLMGDRIQEWQDGMGAMDAFEDNGALIIERANHRSCPGWDGDDDE